MKVANVIEKQTKATEKFPSRPRWHVEFENETKPLLVDEKERVPSVGDDIPIESLEVRPGKFGDFFIYPKEEKPKGVSTQRRISTEESEIWSTKRLCLMKAVELYIHYIPPAVDFTKVADDKAKVGAVVDCGIILNWYQRFLSALMLSIEREAKK
jgi:hypothetical protein